MDAAAPEYARLVTAQRQAAAEHRAARQALVREARAARRTERARGRDPLPAVGRQAVRRVTLPGWLRARPSG